MLVETETGVVLGWTANPLSRSSILPANSMKMKRTKPRPIPSKKVREKKPDWDLYEAMEMIADRKTRERKRIGPSEEAKKLLGKK